MDFPFVVQGGRRDRDATDEDGFQHGVRGHRSGAAHVDLDVLEDRCLLLRRKLVSDRPPRRLGGVPGRILVGQRVGFDHHSVNLVVTIVAPLQRLPDVVLDRLDPLDPLRVRVHRQAEFT